MANKGKTKGSRHHLAKLTEVDIPVIRNRIRTGESMTKIAKEYNVTKGVISHIKNGLNWTHVMDFGC